jgi:hypothetical protein
MSLKDHCRCEHARESHHEKRYACNAAFCDCEEYRLYTDPYEGDPTPTERIMPAAEPLMDPFDGWDVHDDGTPITWPMFPAAPKATP